MRSYWSQPLIHYVWWLIKRGEEKLSKTAMRQHRLRLEWCIHKTGMPKVVIKSQKVEEVSKDSLLEVSESIVPLLTPWFFNSMLQNSGTVNFCCSKPCSLWYLLQQSKEMNILINTPCNDKVPLILLLGMVQKGSWIDL